MKISIGFYLNKYFWILQLPHGKLCLQNNDLTNWNSRPSGVATRALHEFAANCLCTTHCAHWGFDGKWQTEGSSRRLGFERKKAIFLFQEAEVQIEATPMLLFHGNDVAGWFVEQQALPARRPPRAWCCWSCRRTQPLMWGRGCQGCCRRTCCSSGIGAGCWGSTSPSASVAFPRLV